VTSPAAFYWALARASSTYLEDRRWPLSPLILPLRLGPLLFSDLAPSLLPLRLHSLRIYSSDSAPSASTPPTSPRSFSPSDSAPSFLSYKLRPLHIYPSDSAPCDSPPLTPPPLLLPSESLTCSAPYPIPPLRDIFITFSIRIF
jgi:hypothetical protein